MVFVHVSCITEHITENINPVSIQLIIPSCMKVLDKPDYIF